MNIFFNLAKAFDTVNHDISLNKLDNYRIRGTQLKWFATYFKYVYSMFTVAAEA